MGRTAQERSGIHYGQIWTRRVMSGIYVRRVAVAGVWSLAAVVVMMNASMQYVCMRGAASPLRHPAGGYLKATASRNIPHSAYHRLAMKYSSFEKELDETGVTEEDDLVRGTLTGSVGAAGLAAVGYWLGQNPFMIGLMLVAAGVYMLVASASVNTGRNGRYDEELAMAMCAERRYGHDMQVAAESQAVESHVIDVTNAIHEESSRLRDFDWKGVAGASGGALEKTPAGVQYTGKEVLRSYGGVPSNKRTDVVQVRTDKPDDFAVDDGRLSVAGASTGFVLGGTVGVVAGLPLAPFTLGLSIPAALLVGAGIGLTTGAVGGGVVGTVLAHGKQRRTERN